LGKVIWLSACQPRSGAGSRYNPGENRANGASMPLENLPEWWDFELELSPHILDRMIDRDFSEADLRLMIEVADGFRPGSSGGRWNVETVHHGNKWEVVVEPDELDRVIVVITAYKVTTW